MLPRMTTHSEGSRSGETDSYPDATAPGIDVLALLWRARWRMFTMALVVGLAYASFAAWRLASDQPRRSAAQQIVFTFDGAQRGQYPNGVAFSPQDLLAEPVLKSVFDRLQLSGLMKPTDLAAALSITAGAGMQAQALQVSFALRLQNTKLSEPERIRLEKEFRDSMERLRGQEFVLAADFGATQVPNALVSQIVAAIPEQWSHYAKRTRGVAVYDLEVPTILPWDASAPLLDQWVMLEEELRSLETVLGRGVLLPSATTVRTPAGRSLAEIGREVVVLRRAQFEPIADRVTLAAGADGMRRLATNLQASEARFQSAKLEADAARDSFQQYVTMGRADATNAVEAGGGVGARASVPATINLPENLINQLVEMRSQAGDLAYRQKLNDAAIKAKDAMLLAESQFNLDRSRFERLSKSNQASESRESLDEIIRTLGSLNARLKTLSNDASFLLKALADQNLNPASVLYRLEGPTIVTEQGAVSWRSLGLGFFGAEAAALALGVVWSIVPGRRSGEEGRKVESVGTAAAMPQRRRDAVAV